MVGRCGRVSSVVVGVVAVQGSLLWFSVGSGGGSSSSSSIGDKGSNRGNTHSSSGVYSCTDNSIVSNTNNRRIGSKLGY